MNRLVLVLPLLLLGACRDPSEAPSASPSTEPTAPATAAAPATSATVDTSLPTLAHLRFGKPVAANSGWARDAMQASDDCLIYNARTVPHAYAIVINNRLERVSFATGAAFRLPSGITLGSDEAEVRRAYPDLLAEPHKYQAAPAGYLTQPDLGAGQPRLRFEIGTNRKVEVIHIGLPPSLGLVEGCA